MKELNVLSLCDGMSCGQISLIEEDFIIKQYYASEIDKNAIKVTQDNFPDTIQLGDVMNFVLETGENNEIVLDEFRNKKLLEYKYIHNNADQILIFYAYIYDLNFKDSVKLLTSSNYLDKFTERVLEHFPSETLHNQMKEPGVKYSLDFCELNESYINMYFETSEVYDLEDVGKVRNVIQVSNDEIKREALKFSCVAKIYFDVDDPVYGSMYLTAENRVK